MAHSTSQQGQTSVNIPQLIAVAIVGFLAIRWYLSKTPGGASSNTSASASSRADGGRQVDIAKVDSVHNIFPDLDRRTIAWDLHRNGGNVSATTERVLGGRGLDNPPPTYQPAGLTPVATSDSGTATSTARQTGKGVGGDDLITRYGLQSRVGGKGKEAVLSDSAEKKKNAWASDKVSRADALKKKREEMILAARRRMEEKDIQA
nr:coupling of ubiquitin conjugation to er degradation protein 1 [Quercus suber]POF00907.1 coupling of ubiquitin conjugation to er degradation protein 1 [Quercus suber]